MHQIKKGETLSEIADHYKTSVSRIVGDNNLKREAIYKTVYERRYKKIGKRTFYKTVPVRKFDRYDYLAKEGQKLKIIK